MDSAPFFRIAAFVCTIALALEPARGWAEVYVWTDAEGGVRMTENLSEVPPAQRARAIQAGAKVSRSELALPRDVDEERRPAAKLTARASAKPAPQKKAAARRHVLRVERAGAEMRVEAVVDGVVVPFILDTGASICTLPRWAVDQMGVEIDEDTPMIPISGISGQTQMVPELQVGSVALGDAEVSDLSMAVLDTLQEGLLGMPFFNHFRVSTDPASGILVLEEIDLDAVDGVAGGLNEDSWRQRFRSRRWSLEAVSRELEQVPGDHVTARARLEKKKEYWEKQLDELEIQATQAGVPQAWRE